MMKQFIYFILFFTACFLFESCDDDEKLILELDKTEISLAHLNALEIVKITSNTEWKITGIPDWLNYTHSFYDDLTEEIYFSAKTNDTFEQRSATLTFTNGHINKTLSVTQLSLQEAEPFIQFEKDYVDLSVFGEEKRFELQTNRPWKIENAKDIPRWLSISSTSGDQSSIITFKVNENRLLRRQEIQLLFTAGDVKRNLLVSQTGQRDIMTGPFLSIFRFKEMGFSNNLTYCDVKTNSMFVNPNITDKIFLGNLVSHNIANGVDISQFPGYTFRPVSLTSSASDEAYEKIPSITEQRALAEEIISMKPQKTASIIEDNGVDFFSYRLLHAIGMTNLGIKLDEIVTGNSYVQKEMGDKYGLIFSFKRIAFSLDLNLSKDESLINEKLKDIDQSKGVSYVSSVSYGNLGLLVVQSVTDSRELKTAINKFLKGSSLSPAETDILSSAEICYVYFDNHNRVQSEKDSLKALNAFKDARRSKSFDNIYPVGFHVSDFISRNSNTLSYRIDIP